MPCNTSPACRFFAADTLEAWMVATKALTFGRLASSRTGAASQERAMVHKVCTKALRPSVEVRVGMVCDRHYMSRTIPHRRYESLLQFEGCHESKNGFRSEMHSFIHSFIHLLIHSFIHSLIHSLISFIHSLIHFIRHRQANRVL